MTPTTDDTQPDEASGRGVEAGPCLEPCPFCGESAGFGYVDDVASPDHGGHFVQCSNASCCGSVGLIYAAGDDPKPLLIEHWNRRAHPKPEGEAMREKVARIVAGIGPPFSVSVGPVTVARWERALAKADAILSLMEGR